jgi:hypothetical protein
MPMATSDERIVRMHDIEKGDRIGFATVKDDRGNGYVIDWAEEVVHEEGMVTIKTSGGHSLRRTPTHTLRRYKRADRGADG